MEMCTWNWANCSVNLFYFSLPCVRKMLLNFTFVAFSCNRFEVRFTCLGGNYTVKANLEKTTKKLFPLSHVHTASKKKKYVKKRVKKQHYWKIQKREREEAGRFQRSLDLIAFDIESLCARC